MGSTSACEPFSVIKSATSTATVVFDASTNMAWSGAETTGASAYDTATVTGVSGFTPTGSVTYTFYTSGDCSGSGTTESPPGGSSLSGGLVPNSITVGPLVAASYSFRAVYSGDSNYVGSTSACERFIVNKATTTTETALSTSAGVSIPVGGTVPKGTSVNDTATVTGVSGIVPTGSVTYIFYTNARCSGSGTAQTATMSGGLVPNSTATGPLAANSYSFKATYSGDNNYLSSTSSCEPFNVGLTSFVSTQFFTSANILIPNGESNGSVLNGTSVYDTTTVTGVNGVTPTGTLTYTFFAGNGCIGFGAAQTVTLGKGGAVPNSATHGPLSSGLYSFNATYNGDTNYYPVTSSCEWFEVWVGGTVGGTVVPVNKLTLLAPLIGLVSVILTAVTATVLSYRRRLGRTASKSGTAGRPRKIF